MQETAIKNFESKFRFLAGLVLTVFVILMLRLWILQIMQGASIMVKSKENQTRIIRVNAPRGLFYDRHGKILVTSRISHNVSVVPEDIKDKPEVLASLSRLLNLPESDILEKMKPDPKYPRAPYQYIPISKDIDSGTVIKVLERKLDLPGVEVDEVPVRLYPNNDFASHLFGYIREIDQKELEGLKEKSYRPGDLIGKTGLERTYEEYLRGVDGGKIFEVDIHGRPLRLLENREAIPGNNLHLTIDERVQATAEKALEDQLAYLQHNSKYRNARSGAVIALDPRTGDVLAMASKPGFDPNLFMGKISKETAQNLYNNKLYPLTNRIIQGEFSPGSTFKPITVLSALMEGKADDKSQFYCNGYDPVWGKRFKCWTVTGHVPPHGSEDIIAGIKNSCNIVMAELSRRVGADTLAKYSRFFGLGRPTGLKLNPGERFGFVPDTAWKFRNTKDKKWYPLETLHFGIGQGYLTVTPIQLAQVYAAIANNGKVFRPQLVKKITDPSGKVLQTFKPQLTADLRIPQKYMDMVHKGLLGVINEGTGSYAFNGFPLDKYPVAGKTGTVQKPPYDNSGIFACYAPANKPEIVVIVLIEQGGSGSLAAPVGRKILETYFKLDQPKPASETGTAKPGTSSSTTSTTPSTTVETGTATGQPANSNAANQQVNGNSSPVTPQSGTGATPSGD